jgi:hypothetical protein
VASALAVLEQAFTWTKTRIVANDHPETWFFSARSFPKSASPEEQGKTLSGLHSKFVLFVIDESGAIPTTVLRAAEQALSNKPAFGKILQAGNPISLEGMLYAAATQLAAQWHIIRVTGDPDDPKRSPRIDKAWAEHQIQTYGRDNPWVMSYILGQFPPSSLNSLLGPEDVRAAMQRELPITAYNWAQARLGVDVARFGDDRTVIFPRQGKRAFAPQIMRHARDSAVSTDIATAVLAGARNTPRRRRSWTRPAGGRRGRAMCSWRAIRTIRRSTCSSTCRGSISGTRTAAPRCGSDDRVGEGGRVAAEYSGARRRTLDADLHLRERQVSDRAEGSGESPARALAGPGRRARVDLWVAGDGAGIREEARKDKLCVAGKPWEALDPARGGARAEGRQAAVSVERRARAVHQSGGERRPRQPARHRYAPTGNGANDAGAEFYQNHVREIEYRSHARVGYAGAFADA